jgi:hypothetical protein
MRCEAQNRSGIAVFLSRFVRVRLERVHRTDDATIGSGGCARSAAARRSIEASLMPERHADRSTRWGSRWAVSSTGRVSGDCHTIEWEGLERATQFIRLRWGGALAVSVLAEPVVPVEADPSGLAARRRAA